MSFKALKVLHKIKQLYELPRTKKRFDKYLLLLQGPEKKEMILPIASFNPMGKELAKEKLNRLIELNAEEILEEVIFEINNKLETDKIENRVIQISLNLVDDVEGSWSEFYSADYKSKFEIDSLLKRNFCTPIFWTSESLTSKIITRRIKEYIYRTHYWIENGKAEKLGDKLEQEINVQMHFNNTISNLSELDITLMESFVSNNMESEDSSLSINFFYGDEGSKKMNNRTYRIIENGGFKFAKYISQKRREAK